MIAKKQEEKQSKGPHWIIYSKSRGSIWKGQFVSFESARAELDLQMAGLLPEVREAQDWRIEKRFA